MKFILGKKIEMTQIWREDKLIAVTKVQVGPCTVVQVKDEKKDGYKAVQVGYGVKKEKNIKKPQIGHFKGLDNFRYLKEFRLNKEETNLKRGDKFDVSSFEKGDKIELTGVSKGKGFQGVVKRHGFAGQIKTHGTKDQVRMPGSVGATGPAHVFKGTRMGGHMGGNRVTFKTGEIIDIDLENNILFVKGGVPGARNGLVIISASGELKVITDSPVKEESTVEKTEEIVEKAGEKLKEASAENPLEATGESLTNDSKEGSK